MSDSEELESNIDDYDIFSAPGEKEIEEIEADPNAANSDSEDELDYDVDDAEHNMMTEKIKMHKMIDAEDSRMPDVMSKYEYVQMLTVGSSLNTRGVIPCDGIKAGCKNPTDIAKIQIMMRKAKQCVLRVDADGNYCKWRLSDFAYFPAHAVEEFKQLASTYANDHREWLDSMSDNPDIGS